MASLMFVVKPLLPLIYLTNVLPTQTNESEAFAHSPLQRLDRWTAASWLGTWISRKTESRNRARRWETTSNQYRFWSTVYYWWLHLDWDCPPDQIQSHLRMLNIFLNSPGLVSCVFCRLIWPWCHNIKKVLFLKTSPLYIYSQPQ